MIAIRLAVLATALAGLSGCREPHLGDVDTGVPGPDAPSWPAPRTDLVPAVGTPDALDMATWNIENFPLRLSSPAWVADVVASLDLDLIAVQEIAGDQAFAELVARLPEHEAILSTHVYPSGDYQKVGFLYRAAVLMPLSQELLFTGDPYNFPRPPLAVRFAVQGTELDFLAITLHLKAGGTSDDVERRQVAIQRLDEYVRAVIADGYEDQIILLGDFNEVLSTASGQAVWEPLLGAPELYDVHTLRLPAGAMSFLPGGRLIDHVVSTAALDPELAGGQVQVPRLDLDIPGYLSVISDHLPVVTSMPGVVP